MKFQEEVLAAFPCDAEVADSEFLPLDCESEFARQFNIGLGVLMLNQECTSINGRDMRNNVSGLQRGGAALLKPAVKTQVSQIHSKSGSSTAPQSPGYNIR
jgi:hypothetical protein